MKLKNILSTLWDEISRSWRGQELQLPTSDAAQENIVRINLPPKPATTPGSSAENHTRPAPAADAEPHPYTRLQANQFVDISDPNQTVEIQMPTGKVRDVTVHELFNQYFKFGLLPDRMTGNIAATQNGRPVKLSGVAILHAIQQEAARHLGHKDLSLWIKLPTLPTCTDLSDESLWLRDYEAQVILGGLNGQETGIAMPQLLNIYNERGYRPATVSGACGVFHRKDGSSGRLEGHDIARNFTTLARTYLKYLKPDPEVSSRKLGRWARLCLAVARRVSPGIVRPELLPPDHR
jgi:hypothetical protein